MKICIKLEEGKVTEIELYEASEAFVAETLKTMLGTQATSLPSKEDSKLKGKALRSYVNKAKSKAKPKAKPAAKPKAPLRSRHTNASSLGKKGWAGVLQMHRKECEEGLKLTTLDACFFPENHYTLPGEEHPTTVFGKASQIGSFYKLTKLYPTVLQQLSLERWMQLVTMLGEVGTFPSISPTSAETYYRKCLRQNKQD